MRRGAVVTIESTGSIADLRLAGVGLIQRRSKSFRQLHHVIVRPEVHEEQPRLLVEHVAVNGRNGDAILAQCLDDGIDLFTNQYKVTGYCRFSWTRGLEVDRRRYAHGWRDRHSAVGDLFRPRYGVL